jgi:hypothetical protein
MALKKALKKYDDDREYADGLRRTIAQKEKELAALRSKP